MAGAFFAPSSGRTGSSSPSSSARVMPKWSAIFWRVFGCGTTTPFFQLETLCKFTPSILANRYEEYPALSMQ
nr:MAG TPA: hypothetical protein [Caudoviricetes sp.]